MLALTITIVLLLILLNGLFAMSELAVVSSKQARLKARADQGDKGAAAALKLSEDPTRFLSAVQVGITLIGILAGAYGQATIAAELDLMLETVPGMAPYSEIVSTAIVVMILTYLSLILGELVPKRLALIMPETLASVMARPLNLMALIMSPFVSLLTASTAGVLSLLGIKDNKGDSITHEEVETMLAEGAGAGVIEPEEKLMMQEVMRLGDRAIRVAMTPRRDVYWVSLEDDAQTLRDDIRNCPYSRLVVANGPSIDEAVGIVHKRDVADALLETGHFDLKTLLKAPLIIPESITILNALTQFKSANVHMAFVVNEFGALEGVVTPNDLLEMIAGDFNEEHDVEPALIQPREDGSWLVDGRADIVEMGDLLGVKLTDTEGYHTLAGLVLHEIGRFPEEGEIIDLGWFVVEIVDLDARRIDKMIVRRKTDNELAR